MNYINTLKNLLAHLGLLTDIEPTQDEKLVQACEWALNTEGYVLKPYEAVALKPILGTLKAIEKDKVSYFIPPRQLKIDLEKGELLTNSLPSKTDLEKQLENLKRDLQKAKSDEWLTVLEREASTLAVSEEYQDLPLFDFIKMTVGIAECLETGNGKLRLAGGSLSGIQAYLYEIVSKNAARLLKGRSFYIQLLIDMVLEQVSEKFELSPCHVVYSSGGGFYVLMPDTEGVEDEFKNYSKEIAKKIYAYHGTQLFIELAITDAFDQSAILENNPETNEKGIWDKLITGLNQSKNKRLSQNDQLLDAFFGVAEVGGVAERDPITNEEFDLDENGKPIRVKLHKKMKDSDPNTIWVKPTTKQQVTLGARLREADLWFTFNENDNSEILKYLTDPFGKNHYLRPFGRTEVIRTKNNNARILNEFKDNIPCVFYGGNKPPVFKQEDFNKYPELQQEYDLGDIKPFEYLVGDASLQKLAILRMDVDSLGKIFSEQMSTPQYNLNFTRYAATSRSLDFFFKGYLNTLQQNFKDTTSIIYSGGDDLFIVGKWNDILQFAQDIHDTFKEWSCGNLSISGGMVILPPKFPIMQGAKMAEEVEKAAKGRKNIEQKIDADSIYLFDKALKWKTEFIIVKELFEELKKFIEDTDNRSILSKINAYALLHKNGGQSWRWNMAYDLSRYCKDKKLTGISAEFIKKISVNTFLDYHNSKKIENCPYTYLELLQVAARWVELELRTKSKNNK